MEEHKISEIELLQRKLEGKEYELKTIINKCDMLKGEVEEIKNKIKNFKIGVTDNLKSGTRLTFKDEDDKIIKTVLTRDYKHRYGIVLLSNYDEDLFAYSYIDLNCIYSDTAIKEFCKQFYCDLIKVEELNDDYNNN